MANYANFDTTFPESVAQRLEEVSHDLKTFIEAAWAKQLAEVTGKIEQEVEAKSSAKEASRSLEEQLAEARSRIQVLERELELSRSKQQNCQESKAISASPVSTPPPTTPPALIAPATGTLPHVGAKASPPLASAALPARGGAPQVQTGDAKHGSLVTSLSGFDAALQRVTSNAQAPPKRWRVNNFDLGAVAVPQSVNIMIHFITNFREELMLHYGISHDGRQWKFAKSQFFKAAQETGVQELQIELDSSDRAPQLMFVLKAPKDTWLKDGGRDFSFLLPEMVVPPAPNHTVPAPNHTVPDTSVKVQHDAVSDAQKWETALQRFQHGRASRTKRGDVVFGSFKISEGCGEIDVVASSDGPQGGINVEFTACLKPCLGQLGVARLHWGTTGSGRRKVWQLPPEAIWPKGTHAADSKACQSLFSKLDADFQILSLTIPKDSDVPGIAFVVKIDPGDRWLKNDDGRDCIIMFKADSSRWRGLWPEVAQRIVEAECDWDHMTLMHRYNLCSELVGKWEQDKEPDVVRCPSWSALFRTNSWSRIPSMSLLEVDVQSSVEAAEFWSWMFVWQRFSFMRLLDWQRNYNTKPRELAGATDNLARKLCSAWKAFPEVRLWVRWTLSTLGRGGNKGQEIRDEILHIMHRNKIPETAGHFYEQWHQKLHNNTTPDDVGICRALIAFLRSNGNMGEYWKVLLDHGITKDRLASFERPITKEPYLHGDTGSLIFEFENYLRILQSVHDALDLQTALEHSRWCLPGDLPGKIEDICRNCVQGGGLRRSRSLSDFRGQDYGSLDDSHRRFMKAADARLGLLALLNDPRVDENAVRQLLLLDYAIETQQSVLIQGMGAENRLPQLCDQLKSLLIAVLGHLPLFAELRVVLLDWMRLSPDCATLRYNGSAVESALLLKAMCDRVSRVIGEQVDNFQDIMGPKAYHLGGAAGVQKEVLDVFVDEVLRGSALFSISLVLKRLEPVLRNLAHLPPWQLISAVNKPVQGELQLIPRMLHIQDKVFDVPTVLLSGAVSGEEEVPVGVQAVLVRSAAEAPDILSHCAVRARNSGVLLATCFDPDLSSRIAAELEGQWVEVLCKPDGSLSVERAQRPKQDPAKMRRLSRQMSRECTQESLQMGLQEKPLKMNLRDDLKCSWCVRPDEMDKHKVGSKSLNLAMLSPKLPKDLRTPQAVALPYGCLQKVLLHPDNSEVLPKLDRTLSKLQPNTSNQDAHAIFEEARLIIEELQMPQQLAQALKQSMDEVGTKEGEHRLQNFYNETEAWDATKKVWASLFALRPWVSLAKAGRSFHDLNMAVLVQELLPAQYAFVLHTKNPFTDDPEEVYGELVPGRGEALVGNFPGRALSFRGKKGQQPVVTSFLSKSVRLQTQECLIFRSDSNGEDLEGFAGAGLFESICAREDIRCAVKLHKLRVVCDADYRRQLLHRLVEAGREVERAFNGQPQDIEGCVDHQDRIFIVQSRPQV